jgi:hypothetical protein
MKAFYDSETEVATADGILYLWCKEGKNQRLSTYMVEADASGTTGNDPEGISAVDFEVITDNNPVYWDNVIVSTADPDGPCGNYTGVSGLTVFCEDFEDHQSDTCTDYGWTHPGGAVDCQFTTSNEAANNKYSAEVEDTGAGTGRLIYDYTDLDEGYVKWNWRTWDNAVSFTSYDWLFLSNEITGKFGTDNKINWQVHSGGVTINDCLCNGKTIDDSDQWYSMKIYYKESSGASDGEFYFWCRKGTGFALPTDTGVADCSTTVHNNQNDLQEFEIYNSSNNNPFVYDNIIVTDGTADNPDPDYSSYCNLSAPDWQEYTHWSVDWDYHIDQRRACYDGGDSFQFAIGDDATIAMPATASPSGATANCSGGFAVLVESASSEGIYYTDWTNGPSDIWDGGWIWRGCFNFSGNPTATTWPFYTYVTYLQDMFGVYVQINGMVFVSYEDDNEGSVDIDTGFDIDDDCSGSCDDKWWMLEVQFDPTRCTGDGDDCGDAGEDELAVRWVSDTDGDGSFADESWSAWVYEASTEDLDAWGTVPTQFKTGADWDNADYWTDGFQFNVNYTYTTP